MFFFIIIFAAYSTNNLYQASNNLNNNNNHNNNANNGTTSTPTTKKQTRVSRPPSCARPTISSLRKMNRTFSLNNVSQVGTAQTNIPNTPIVQEVQQQSTPPQIVLPLTQASLAMANAASTSSFSSSIMTNDPVMRMNLINNANKLSSKYASSNYLNDYSTNKQFQPQQTRTTPRRRTPRNAEEFLLAAGIADPESYLNKGYYVGSMVDLTEFTNKNQNPQQPQSQQQISNSNQVQQTLQNPSSSSSSSIQQPYFLEPNNVKRRNSIHETTSLSLANLNYLGNNFMDSNSNEQSNGTKNSMRNQNYYRNLNNYNKMRSMTTAIVGPNSGQYEDMGNQSDPMHGDAGSTSNGSTAPSSDSSSSPTPSLQQKMPFTNTLGPLMSAVSNLSPASNKTINNFLDQRFFSTNNNTNEDEFDDYEYLERNLGAEPLNSSFGRKKKLDTNTTTNTNVTDYYTDESNSCHNEDFKVSSHHFMTMDKKYLGDFNQSSSSSVNTTQAFHKNTSLSLVHNAANNNINNNNNIKHNNSNINNGMANGQAQILTNNVNTAPSTLPTNNNWDHTSLASTNSIYSGLYFFARKIK